MEKSESAAREVKRLGEEVVYEIKVRGRVKILIIDKTQ